MNETNNHGHKLLIWGSAVGILAVLLVVFLYVHKHNTDSTKQSSNSATTQSPKPLNADPSTTNPYTGPNQPKTATNTSESAVQSGCSKLVLSKGTSEGTAGSTYWHIIITNNGDASCKLSGYPKVVVNDTKIALTAKKNTVYTDANVTLAPKGGKAYVLVALPDPGNVDKTKTKCTDASMSNLFMTMPGETAAIATQFRSTACQGFTASAIHPGS